VDVDTTWDETRLDGYGPLAHGLAGKHGGGGAGCESEEDGGELHFDDGVWNELQILRVDENVLRVIDAGDFVVISEMVAFIHHRQSLPDTTVMHVLS
jgi:hypothetical protein